MGFRLALILALLCPSVALAAESGDLVSIQQVAHLTKKAMDFSKRVMGKLKELPSKSGVDFYRVHYLTRDLKDELVTASGLLMLPSDRPNPLSVISYQHGTVVEQKNVPSSGSLNPEALAGALAFGSMGYAVVAADYLGLGVHQGIHPYLHADSEASATLDLLKALEEVAEQSKLQLNGKLFLAGYSQGGHSTLALHRALQGSPESIGLKVVASAPMAGPYDLSRTSILSGMSQPNHQSSFYGAYLVLSMNQVYGLPGNLSKVFKAPYGKKIPSLFSGKTPFTQVMAQLPDTPSDLFQKGFIHALKTRADHPFMKVVAQNDVYHWKPEVPVLFLHARGDTIVPYGNSEVAYKTMKSLGANVILANLGDTLDHGTAIPAAFVAAYRWFNALSPNP